MTMKIAFLFPGQGSQTLGMLKPLLDHPELGPSALEVAAEADQQLGGGLLHTIAEGPAEDLNLTVNTQPAMLLADALLYRAWLERGGPKAALTAGHSLGEYAAAVASGAFTVNQAIKLVRIRAQAMQSAVPVGQGGMAAILGLDDATVLSLCAEVSKGGELAEAVNFNAPNQVVVAGTATGVTQLCEKAKTAGAKRALPLPVSAPFHSSLMKPAADVLAQALKDISPTDLHTPLVCNVDVTAIQSAQALTDALIRQAYSPVRWVESIQMLESMGADLFIECGPGKVLSGLVKRISNLPVLSVSCPESLDKALAEINQ